MGLFKVDEDLKIRKDELMTAAAKAANYRGFEMKDPSKCADAHSWANMIYEQINTMARHFNRNRPREGRRTPRWMEEFFAMSSDQVRCSDGGNNESGEEESRAEDEEEDGDHEEEEEGVEEEKDGDGDEEAEGDDGDNHEEDEEEEEGGGLEGTGGGEEDEEEGGDAQAHDGEVQTEGRCEENGRREGQGQDCR